MNKVAPSSTGLNSISFNMPSFDDKNKYFLTEKKPVEKKLIKKKIISKPIGNTFVHVNHIGYSGNNIFNVIFCLKLTLIFKYLFFFNSKG